MVAKETMETHCVRSWTQVRRVLMFRHQLRLRIHASVVPGSCFWVVNVLIRISCDATTCKTSDTGAVCSPRLLDIHVLVPDTNCVDVNGDFGDTLF